MIVAEHAAAGRAANDFYDKRSRNMLMSVDVIETVHAEPRDLVNSPVYRVNFWQRPSPEQAWNLDAYALTGVEEVTEVLRWANEHALGRRLEVFAEIDDVETGSFEDPRKAGLVRLLGSDPNAGERNEVGGFHKM